ncbi:MAG: DUF5666 domain-containing protein [Woeseiaceae bacterium]|nr:DUF5666 domain-containing protein [Woeseiaceae bacterium]
MKRTLQLIVTLGTCAAFAACDGGGISVDIQGPSFGGAPDISEPVASIGVATAGDSLYVNGVRYDTHSATVLINGEPDTITNIRDGHIVQLEGRIGGLGLAGNAALVNVDAHVIGPVESIDFDDIAITVLGQTVRIGMTTRFGAGVDPDDLAGLRLGAHIAASGYVAADGGLEATRIDLVTAGSTVQVIGRALAVDTGTRTFRVGSLDVDYGNTRVIGLPLGYPEEGGFVLVRGSFINDTLQADELLPVYGSGMRTVRERVYLEGLVTQFTGTSAFGVGAHRVSTTATTGFNSGTRDDLGADAQIHVYGRIGSDGVTIVADTITFLSLVER